ncbi:uncharacterized protein K452DRAFT_352982 [Aplosporella prunicola CBS 121167]|uniref:Cation/H+ exchanger transmembrane domain-containing protein n=1 Tax=Aplosporella prunicola CBS 121167 TaxID=1176127 RepID=A0A6A6B4T7_9PEZI|nr:uncharacterized protein K452DRAFT_352982 [Aplosporella prunicola CBS 121167]KAF2138413.1 hypothetical protein K452DRAFT_352982 [Aplosporella prunicola CBS 121167]
MVWSQIEPTAPHLTYIVLSTFLILYALFDLFIRNRLHLSEPPLATAVGIIFGPKGAGILHPEHWGIDDVFMQEFTRIILGIQCFAVGIELPPHWFSQHWRSVAYMLGPVMAYGWIVCAVFIHFVLNIDFVTSLIIAACLTPTDPILAASVLSNSQFSTRVPERLKNLLSAESACNDGASFPFIYVGLSILTRTTVRGILGKWFFITILWQCIFGAFLGLIIGQVANRILRFVHDKEMIGSASYLIFYLLAAVFCTGVASTLGTDDFLLAFSAGIGFARDGWFRERTAEARIAEIIDLLLNSTMFVYFGSIIPWSSFTMKSELFRINPGLLLGLLVLVLLFRRIPVVFTLQPLIKDIQTRREALFAGHFGPIGIGALFLAIESRAQLETDSSEPLPHPPGDLPLRRQRAVEVIWPVVCFVVLGSTMVHGLSTLAISVGSHYSRKEGERAPLIGGERERFAGMIHEEIEEEEEEAGDCAY